MWQIVSNTPLWVFILFFFLLFLGLSQRKDRKISFKRAIVLPFIMLFLSFLGVTSSFGLDFSSFLFWFLGLSFGVVLNSLLKLPRNCIYIKNENLFLIKGSFIPLFLIMAIFFVKYYVAVVTAKQLGFIDTYGFILIVSLLYGFFSGIFFGRVFILKSLKDKS